MKGLFTTKVIFIAFAIFNSVNCLNLDKAGNQVDSDSLKKSNNTSLEIQNDDPTQVKGNIGSITSLISNPSQLISQLQTTINKFLNTLNNTLSAGSSGNITALLSSLKNITSRSSSEFRLEDADFMLANISEIVKSSTHSKADLLSNFPSVVEEQVQGAIEDFRKALFDLRNSIQENENIQTNEQISSSSAPATLNKKTGNDVDATVAVDPNESAAAATGEQETNGSREKNGLRSMFNQLQSQVDSNIQRSISNAQSTIQDSLQIARQSTQIMRNQTSSFMNEVQKVFTEMSAPIRQFFEQLRRGLPTAVVSA